MIKTLLALALLLAPSLALAKAKDIPLPRPSPVKMAYAQAAVNPDPFKVNPQPQPQPQATQPVQPVVVTAAAPASMWGDAIQGIWALLGTIITALLGKIAFKPPAIPTATPVIDATHPDFHAAIDQALLRLVQTGLPGQALQTGLGLVPGVGGLAGALEPMLRKVVTDVLERKLSAVEDAPAASPISGLPQDFFQQIEDRIQAAIARKG